MSKFHLIRSISALNNYILCAQFDDGSIRTYDVKPLFEEIKEFKTLENNFTLFKKVKVDVGGYGVVWNKELDLSSDEIWENGVVINTPFDSLLSFADAAKNWNIDESTLRKAISYGKLKAGTDCCKYGKQWVVSQSAMEREYGYQTKDVWETLMVADKGADYEAKNGLDN